MHAGGLSLRRSSVTSWPAPGPAWVSAAGSYASANGSSSFIAVEFTVLFRPDGTTGFNQIDMAKAGSINRSYPRNRAGTFRFCALNTHALYGTRVTLSLTTS